MWLVRQPDGSWIDRDRKRPQWQPRRPIGMAEKEESADGVARKSFAALADLIYRQWQDDYRKQRPELRKADGRRLPLDSTIAAPRRG